MTEITEPPSFNDPVTQSKDLAANKKTESYLLYRAERLPENKQTSIPAETYSFAGIQGQHQLIIRDLPLCGYNKHKWY